MRHQIICIYVFFFTQDMSSVLAFCSCPYKAFFCIFPNAWNSLSLHMRILYHDDILWIYWATSWTIPLHLPLTDIYWRPCPYLWGRRLVIKHRQMNDFICSWICVKNEKEEEEAENHFFFFIFVTLILHLFYFIFVPTLILFYLYFIFVPKSKVLDFCPWFIVNKIILK